MKNSLILVTILSAIIFCAGCATTDPFNVPTAAETVVKESSATARDFAKALNGRFYDMDKGSLRKSPDVILVASLVEVSHIRQSSGFGRIFSEQLAGELSKKGFNVSDIKLADGVRVSNGKSEWSEGEFALSREVQEITKERQATAIVVGTYAKGKEDVLVAVRVVDAKTGKILAARSFTVPFDVVLFSTTRQ